MASSTSKPAAAGALSSTTRRTEAREEAQKGGKGAHPHHEDDGVHGGVGESLAEAQSTARSCGSGGSSTRIPATSSKIGRLLLLGDVGEAGAPSGHLLPSFGWLGARVRAAVHSG